ncbi:MAG: hypothetical protein IPJ56_02570 [Gemmatimonadetes bacterium]|nr:hypothetical protein [Gemmatimonadota bacterium]
MEHAEGTAEYISKLRAARDTCRKIADESLNQVQKVAASISSMASAVIASEASLGETFQSERFGDSRYDKLLREVVERAVAIVSLSGGDVRLSLNALDRMRTGGQMLTKELVQSNGVPERLLQMGVAVGYVGPFDEQVDAWYCIADFVAFRSWRVKDDSCDARELAVSLYEECGLPVSTNHLSHLAASGKAAAAVRLAREARDEYAKGNGDEARRLERKSAISLAQAAGGRRWAREQATEWVQHYLGGGNANG